MNNKFETVAGKQNIQLFLLFVWYYQRRENDKHVTLQQRFLSKNV